MRYLDLFAGIGGFHTAFDRLGFECVGFAEIDKFARTSYKAIHNTEGVIEWHDITEVKDEEFAELKGRVDIISGGFPCQAFSVAGRRGGFDDTRGTLFFEVARAAKEIQPRFLLLENVKGLLNHEKGATFGTILNTLQELGYAHIEWGIFNTKYWGIPQNRERVFIVAELTDQPRKPYLLNLLKKQDEMTVTTRLRDVLESTVDEKYYVSDDKAQKLIATLEDSTESDSPIMLGHIDVKGHDFLKRVYSTNGVGNTLTTMQGGGQEPKIAVQLPVRYNRTTGIGHNLNTAYCLSASDWRGLNRNQDQNAVLESEVRATMAPDRPIKHQNGRRIKENDEPMFTLTGQDRHGVLYDTPKFRVRRLTPRECFRLQDFSDDQFEKALSAGVSDSQLYKQAGNSVTVRVVEVIANEIKKRVTE